MKARLDNPFSRKKTAALPDISTKAANGAPMHLKKILVPVDFSNESKKAVHYAVALARHFGASIVLLHVVEPVVYPSDVGYGPVVVQIPNNGTVRNAKARMSVLGKKMSPGKLLSKTMVLNGSPWFEIAEAAKALEIDLIIIGTHGYAGLDHALLGSTAEKVVRHSPCPVFVVRNKEHEFA